MKTLEVMLGADGPEDSPAPTVLTVSTDAPAGDECRAICDAAVALAQRAHPGATLAYAWKPQA